MAAVGTKRAASGSPSRAPKSTKRAALSQPLDPCLALLHDDNALTVAARSMMRAGAPFALAVPKGERDAYQEELVTALTAMLRGVETAKVDACKEAEQKLAHIKEQQHESEEVLAKAKQEASDSKETRDARTSDMTAALATVQGARQAVSDAQDGLQKLDEEKQQLIAKKEEMMRCVREDWARLSEGQFSGKEWRLRVKLCDSIEKVLDGLGVEESIKLALPVAVKPKAEERPVFARKAVDRVSEVLDASVTALQRRLDGFDSEVADGRAAITSSEEAATTAEAALVQIENAVVDSENKLAAASELVDTSLAAFRDAGKLTSSSSALHSSAKEIADETSSVLAKFDSIVQDGLTC